jgi:diguanylate cyclase (GGDEF)-like protein
MTRGMGRMPTRDTEGCRGAAPARRPAAPEAPPLPAVRAIDQQILLGRAVVARAGDVGRLVGQQCPPDLPGRAIAAARLSACLIGRWLVTGRGMSDAHEAVLVGPDEADLSGGAGLVTVARAHIAWRDAMGMVLEEEGARLGVGDGLVAEAVSLVDLSCDRSLVRFARRFEADGPLDGGQDQRAAIASGVIHDRLTGLPNRTLLLDRLDQAVLSMARRPTAATFLRLDLDNFKAITDRFGHAAGEQLVVEVAGRLRGLVRIGDTVARLDGGEFAVLALDLDGSDASAQLLADRIHLAMRVPVVVCERELYTSVTIAMTPVTPEMDRSIGMARADGAQVMVTSAAPAPDRRSTRADRYDRGRSRMAQALADAPALGQLSLDYQPVWRVGGDPVGMEALLRWHHPGLGSVAPNDFIPLLEHSHQIVPVGRWVLEEAARQGRMWQDERRTALTVSVNISARQLHDPSFVDDVGGALRRSRLPAESLILDVTESVLVADGARIGAILQRVRDLGVHIALDDFGTGHSSLLSMRELPVDRLKLDRSVVSGLASEDRDPAIIATVVDLAHRLGLLVVAEGIETEAELRAVGAVGCDEAQGFLLGRPAPARSFSLAEAALSHH